jgi:hypothetical protein
MDGWKGKGAVEWPTPLGDGEQAASGRPHVQRARQLRDTPLKVRNAECSNDMQRLMAYFIVEVAPTALC